MYNYHVKHHKLQWKYGTLLSSPDSSIYISESFLDSLLEFSFSRLILAVGFHAYSNMLGPLHPSELVSSFIWFVILTSDSPATSSPFYNPSLSLFDKIDSLVISTSSISSSKSLLGTSHSYYSLGWILWDTPAPINYNLRLFLIDRVQDSYEEQEFWMTRLDH